MTGHEGYRPGLDGIRAIAVVAVLWFHLDRLPGGNLGVDAFFVVSGWLITWKLLGEVDRSGTISLRRFWVARVRRLAPASLAVLAAIAVVWPLAGIEVASLRRDLLFAAAWSSNWGTISGGGDYWARFGEPSPVTHFWSLAIEEQFYALWPVVLVGLVWLTRSPQGRRIRRATIGLVSTIAAVASIVWMHVGHDAADPTATYMDTFARAHSLLLGAAVAAFTTTRSDGRLRGGTVARRLAPIGAVCATAIVVAVSARGADGDTAWMFRWGFPAFAVAMVPVVVAAADGWAARVLAARPMRWIADRSYGLYLWHWPVFLVMSPERLGITDRAVPIAVLDLSRVAVAMALADLSFRWLETPVRRRTRITGWRAPLAGAGSLAAVGLLAVTLVPGSPAAAGPSIVTLPPAPVDTEPATEGERTTLDEATSPTTVAPAPTGIAAPAPPEVASAGPTPSVPAGAAAGAAAEAAAAAVPATSAPSAVAADVAADLDRPLRVLVTGDSTALHLSEALLVHAGTVPDQLVVGSAAFPGCGLSVADDGRRHVFTDVDGSRGPIDLSGCVAQWRSVPERVVTEAVDVVLVEVGAWDAVDIELADGRIVSAADEVGRDLIAAAYRRFADDVVAAGAVLVWITPTDTHLGWGAVDDPVNDPARWAALRAIVDELTVSHRVIEVDLPGWLAANDLLGPDARPDGIHLGDGLNERLVAELIDPTIAAVEALIASGGG